MSTAGLLLRATEVIGRPVVTLAGDDVAQIKDLVYESGGGHVGGFTLAGRGLFAGPMKTALPWESVTGLGTDAVMVTGEDVLVAAADVVSRADARRGDVLGSRVMTDSGTDLGTVVDVVLEVGRPSEGRGCDVVGYEVDSSPAMGRDGRRVLVPLPDTLAVSGEALMLPASATDFVRDDLAGFGAAVRDFRDHLAGGQRSGQPSGQRSDQQPEAQR